MSGPRDAALFFGGTLLSQVLIFLSGVFVARWLGPANYGALSISRSIYSVVAILAPLGLDLSLLRYLGENRQNWSRSLSHVAMFRLSALVVNLIMVAVMVAFGAHAIQAHIFRLPHLGLYLDLGFVALPLTADVAILSATFRALDAVTFQNVAALYIQPLVRVAALALFLALGFGIPGVLVATAAGLAASNLTMNLALRRIVRQRGITIHPLTPEDRRAVLPVFGYSTWLAAMLLMVLLPRSIDVLILGWYRPVREVGAFAALSAISTLITVAPASVSQTLAPGIAALYATGDLGGVRRGLAGYFRTALLLTSPLFAGLAVFGPWLDTILGSRYIFPAGLCLLVSLSAFLSSVLAPMALALTMTGRHKIEAVSLFVGLVLFTGGAMLLAPRYGGAGVALASVIAYLLVNTARVLISRRLLGGSDIRLEDGLVPALCLAVAFAFRLSADTLAPHDLPARVSTVLGLMATYALLYWSNLLGPSEKAYISHAWRRRLGRSLPRPHKAVP